MRVKAIFTLLGKTQTPWEKDGVKGVSYKGNILQEKGEVVDVIKLTEKQYTDLVVNKEYILVADYGTSPKSGGYLKILSIEECTDAIKKGG